MVSKKVDEQEEDEYAVWRRQQHILYDFIYVHQLTSPSLSVQWLPEAGPVGNNTTYKSYGLLLSSYNEKSLNYINRTSIKMGKAEYEGNPRGYTENNEVRNIVEESGEFYTSSLLKTSGPIELMRCMPQNSQIVAAYSTKRDASIYTFSEPEENNPKFKLGGVSKYCSGMEFSRQAIGRLALCDLKGRTSVWNILTDERIGDTMEPSLSYEREGNRNTCLDWNDENILGVGGDNGSLCVYDIRQATPSVHQLTTSAIASIQFNPGNSNLVLLGCDDATSMVCDTRNLATPLHYLVGHSASVHAIQWCPYISSIVATGGDDKRVMLWDLNRVGSIKVTFDASGIPPELLFIHGGHQDSICGISWNPYLSWNIASTDRKGQLQLWTPAEPQYNPTNDDNAYTHRIIRSG